MVRAKPVLLVCAFSVLPAVVEGRWQVVFLSLLSGSDLRKEAAGTNSTTHDTELGPNLLKAAAQLRTMPKSNFDGSLASASLVFVC